MGNNKAISICPEIGYSIYIRVLIEGHNFPTQEFFRKRSLVNSHLHGKIIYIDT